MLRQEKGITLVALMITIIVLIILAAVTIISVVNSDIIGKSTNGAEKYGAAQEYENAEIENSVKVLDRFENNIARIMAGGTPVNDLIWANYITNNTPIPAVGE